MITKKMTITQRYQDPSFLKEDPLRFQKPVSFMRKHKTSMMFGVYSLAAFLTVTFSDVAHATKIEDQLDAVHKLTTGHFVKTGMGVATIGGAVVAVMKQSPALAAVIVGIGVAFSYYMGWLNTHDWTK